MNNSEAAAALTLPVNLAVNSITNTVHRQHSVLLALPLWKDLPLKTKQAHVKLPYYSLLLLSGLETEPGHGHARQSSYH